MFYKVPTDEEIVDIWVRAFQCISIEPFPYLHKEVGFDLVPNQALIEICREFLLVFYAYLRKPFPTPLFPEVHFDADNEDGSQEAWEVAMKKLYNYNYADYVYNWATYSFGNLRTLQIVDNNQFSAELDWKALLSDWAAKPDHPAWGGMPLTDTSIEYLKLIIWDYNEKMKYVKEKIERADKIFTGIWLEQLEGDGMGSIMSHSRFLLYIEMWEKIFKFLPEDDIKNLQNWGCQQFERIGIPNKLPLQFLTYTGL
jgi:hypothetical protein